MDWWSLPPRSNKQTLNSEAFNFSVSPPPLCHLLFTPGSLFGHCTKNRQPLHAQQKETFTFSSLLPIHFDRLFTHSALCSMNNKKISCASFLWRSKETFPYTFYLRFNSNADDDDIFMTHMHFSFSSILSTVFGAQGEVLLFSHWCDTIQTLPRPFGSIKHIDCSLYLVLSSATSDKHFTARCKIIFFRFPSCWSARFSIESPFNK